MGLVLLLSLVALAAANEAECIRQVNGLSFLDTAWTAGHVRTVCVAEDWLLWFYKNQRSMYNTWVQKEQSVLGTNEIIAHPQLRECLRAYVRQEHSEENFNFLEAVQAFKLLSAPDVRAQKACEIWSTFIASDSEQQVNIKHPTLVTLTTALSACPRDGDYRAAITSTVFDAAAAEILGLLSSDTFPRFRQSAIFQDCVHKNLVEKEIRSFAAVLQNFCDDEAKAYPKRPVPQQAKVEKLLRFYWARKCKSVPGFMPPAFGRARGTAAVPVPRPA